MLKWSPRVQEIVNTFAAKYPEWSQHSSPDEDRRKLTKMIAEQCRYEFGSPWGTKRYGGGPPSTDMIVFKDGTIFWGWDWSIPSGIAQYPEGEDLSLDPQQKFIPVEPVNHLSSDPVPAPPPVEPPPTVDLKPVLDKLDAVMAKLNYLETYLDGPLTDYEGKFKLSYFGDTKFTLTPKG